MKRNFRSILIAMLAVLALCIVCTGAIAESMEEELQETFSNIAFEYGAGFRYSVPASATEEWLVQVEAELEEMAAQGFYYVEIVSGNTATGEESGVDSDAWRTVLKRIYTKCNELNMSVRLHIGYSNGGELFALADEDSDYTEAGRRKVLNDAILDVDGGYVLESGTELPVLGEEDYNASTTLIHVMAVQYTAAMGMAEVTEGTGFMKTTVEKEVELRTMQEVIHISTDEMTYDQESNTLVYTGDALTIGDDGELWSIIVYYQGAMIEDTGMGDSSTTKYSVNYYSLDGMKAFTDTYDNLVFDDELKAMIAENGGGFMADGGDQAPQFDDDTYSENLFAAYPDAMGYEIEDYLPIFYSEFWVLEDEEMMETLKSDKLEVLSLLYQEGLAYLSEWVAENYNGNWIHQAASSTDLDCMTAWMAVSQPECESLFFSDNIGGYVAISSAARMMGNNLVSCEMGGEFNNSYNSSLYNLIAQTNYGLVSGVAQMTLHAYSTLLSETCKWPGNNTFYGSLATWESTQPLWETIALYAEYTRNAQYIIRLGTAQRDVLVYRHSHEDLEGYFKNYDSMLEYGYTFDYINPDLLQLDSMNTIVDGVIDPDGGAYKAIVIDNLLNGDDMSTESAAVILSYAEAGIPVFVIGAVPTDVESLTDDVELLTSLWEQIEATGNMILVEDEDDLGDALLERGVKSNLISTEPSNVTSFMTTEDGSNYYFIFNRGDSYTDVMANKADVDQVYWLKGEGQPYEINLWTGEVTKIADFTVEDGYVGVQLDLEIGATTAIVVTNEEISSIYVTESDEDLEFAYVDGELVLKATEAGEYTATLSDGTAATYSVESVAEALEIDEWTLTVEKWEPTNDYATTTGKDATLTTKTTLEPIALEALESWTDIEEIGDEISGMGYYEATFILDGEFDGAILDLGELFDIVRVYINGTEVIIDELNTSVDLTDVLVAGENTIEITLPTNLENVMLAIGAFTLRSEDAEVYTDEQIVNNDLEQRTVGFWAHMNEQNTITEYGIWGPVTLTPYVYVSAE